MGPMLPRLDRLPGQRVNISPILRQLFNQAQAECNRSIKFVGMPSEADFVGRIEWRDTDILIEIRDTLDNQMAEYIAAHELCHALQLARGYPIVGGRVDEPEAVAIATLVTDFVFDSSVDSMAIEFGFLMAPIFEKWLRSTNFLEAMNKPKNGRRYGDNWIKIWEKLEEARICRSLGLKLPRIPRDFWTLYMAFEIANIIQRSLNFGLSVGLEIRESIRQLTLLSRVVDDLLNIGTLRGTSDNEETVSKLVGIFNYIKAVPGHIYIHKPLTDEIYIGGDWRPRRKQDEAFKGFIEQLFSG